MWCNWLSCVEFILTFRRIPLSLLLLLECFSFGLGSAHVVGGALHTFDRSQCIFGMATFIAARHTFVPFLFGGSNWISDGTNNNPSATKNSTRANLFSDKRKFNLFKIYSHLNANIFFCWVRVCEHRTASHHSLHKFKFTFFYSFFRCLFRHSAILHRKTQRIRDCCWKSLLDAGLGAQCLLCCAQQILYSPPPPRKMQRCLYRLYTMPWHIIHICIAVCPAQHCVLVCARRRTRM